MKTLNLTVVGQAFFFFIFFWLICFGLGYPTLNRYDPRTIEGLSDSNHYFKLVRSGPQEDIGHCRYRVLVPYLAKPIQRLVQGHIATWNDTAFGLLVANSIFVAASSLMIILLGLKLGKGYAVAFTASLIYLLNFSISNYHLSGLVDSAEGCFLLLVTLSMISNNWKFLPILGIIGGLAKESFIPLSFTMAAVYAIWQPASGSERLWRLMQVFFLGTFGLFTVLAFRSLISGQLILPWDIIASEKATNNLILSMWYCITCHEFWYVFVWLLPLGAIRLRHFPRPLVYGSMASAGVVLILGGWNSAYGSVSRAGFNVVGPLLSLSLADLMISLINSWQLFQVNNRR